jgi:hypothetical protein
MGGHVTSSIAADMPVDCQQVAARGFLPADFTETGQAHLSAGGDVFYFENAACLCEADYEQIPRTKAQALSASSHSVAANLYCSAKEH